MHLLMCVYGLLVVSEKALAKWCLVNTLQWEFLLFKCLEYCARKTPLMCHNSVRVCACVFTPWVPVRCRFSEPGQVA